MIFEKLFKPAQGDHLHLVLGISYPALFLFEGCGWLCLRQHRDFLFLFLFLVIVASDEDEESTLPSDGQLGFRLFEVGILRLLLFFLFFVFVFSGGSLEDPMLGVW